MPMYLIERDVPGVGALSDDEAHDLAEKSNGVLADMGGDVQWHHSYAAGDKLFCIYIAPTEARVREHAECGGFPITSIHQVDGVIDPTTGGA